MTNPHLFVTGCARSGTTLLQRMLDSHPQLAVSNDTLIIPRSILALDPEADVPLTTDLVREVTGYKYFEKLGISLEVTERLAASCQTFTEFARGLFDQLAHVRGKPLAGEKEPQYVRRLPLLQRLFPEAQIVHIVRDGRDVALSTLEWVTPARFLGQLALWREEPVAVCALWWRRQVVAGRHGSAIVGEDHCLELRYEELVRSPEAVLRSVATFLGIPFDAQMLRYHVGRTRSDPALPSKKRWLPPTVGLRDWRTALTPRDLQLFETISGDLLSSLGYERATNGDVAADVRAVADRCERWWADNVEHPRSA